MDAARGGLYDALYWLLGAGDNRLLKDSRDRNVLHCAAEIGEERSIGSIIDATSKAVAEQRHCTGVQLSDPSRPKSKSDPCEYNWERVGRANEDDIEPWRPTEIVDLLLKAGLDQLARDKDGLYPAHVAAICRSKEVLLQLMVSQAISFPLRETDVKDIKDFDYRFWHITGRNSMHWLDMVKFCHEVRSSRLILEQIRFPDQDHLRALSEAAKKGDIEMVSYLISKGASLCTHDGRKGAAVHEAAKFGWWSIIELAEGDIDVRSEDGQTALHVACLSPHSNWKTIAALLSKGADINASMIVKNLARMGIWGESKYKFPDGKSGVTPLHCLSTLEYFWQSLAIEPLLAAGADATAQAIPMGNAIHITVAGSYLANSGYRYGHTSDTTVAT